MHIYVYLRRLWRLLVMNVVLFLVEHPHVGVRAEPPGAPLEQTFVLGAHLARLAHLAHACAHICLERRMHMHTSTSRVAYAYAYAYTCTP